MLDYIKNIKPGYGGEIKDTDEMKIMCYNEKIYASYRYLPILISYDMNGMQNNVIKLNVKGIGDIYQKNVEASKHPTVPRISIYPWYFGAKVVDGYFYAYAPYHKHKCLMVLNLNGQHIENIYFPDSPTEHWLLRQKFITKIDNDYIFIDLDNAQVKVYKIR